MAANFRQKILFRRRSLYSMYFMLVPISFKLLTMHFSDDVRGIPPGHLHFTFRSTTLFVVVFSSRFNTWPNDFYVYVCRVLVLLISVTSLNQ